MKDLRLIRKSLALLFKTAPLPLILWAATQAAVMFLNPAEFRLNKLLFDTAEKNIAVGWNTYAVRNTIAVIMLYFLMFFIRMISSKLNDVSLTYASTRISAGIQRKLIEKLIRVPYINYENGDFYNSLQAANDENSGGNLVQIYIGVAGTLIQLGSMTVMSFMLARFSPWAVIIAITCCIPGFIHQRAFGSRNWEFATSKIPLIRKMNYYFNLVMSHEAFKENKLYNLPPFYMAKHGELFEKYYDELRKFNNDNCLKGILLALLHSCGTASVVFWIYFSAAGGLITLGDAVMYTGLALSLYGAVQYIVHMIGSMVYSLRMSGNLVSFLKSEDETAQSSESCLLHQDVKSTILQNDTESRSLQSNAVSCMLQDNAEIYGHQHNNDIVLNDVHFTYPGSDKEVLKGVSCRIKQGERIALVGLNGSGKTTLVKLLTGLYPVSKGSISVKGISAGSMSPAGIAGTFSVCFQDYNIYSYTIRENISFGNMNILTDDDAVLEAAQKSGFLQVLRDTGRSVDCYVNRDFTDDGLVPSRGQEQKLALARAFAGKGDIILLDEPSASLDIVAENEIFERTLDLIHGKTVFFITHRLANVVSADRILFLKDGVITEQGTHRQLMELNGEYAELFRMQAEKYTAAFLSSV